ncbi:FG-GAP repeat protein [Trichuris suis]|nr:FG-GAP repeat protein [Trichuris suis]
MLYLCVALCCICLSAADVNQRPKTIVTTRVPGEIMAYVDIDFNRCTDLIVKTARSVLYVFLAEPDGENFTQAHRFTITLPQQYDIQNVAVSDFDGDLFPDLLISSKMEGSLDYVVHLCWGSNVEFSCFHSTQWIFPDQPQVLDCNCDQIGDFFAMIDQGRGRICFLGNQNRKFTARPFLESSPLALRRPFVPAIVDITGDLISEIVLPVRPESNRTELARFEVWTTDKESKQWMPLVPAILPPIIPKKRSLFPPTNNDESLVGGPLFEDFNADGMMDALVAVCPSHGICSQLDLYLWLDGQWHWQAVNFSNGDEPEPWHLKANLVEHPFAVRAGDFTSDGFADLLIVLEKKNGSRGVFVLENRPSYPGDGQCESPRKFVLQWTPLYKSRFVEEATFFDVMETGSLDVVVLERKETGHAMSVFVSSSFEFETTFLKVEVNSPLCNESCEEAGHGPSVIWPGSTVQVRFKDLDAHSFGGTHSLLYSSTHRSLLLPYKVFGLGRSLSFIEGMSTGIPTWSHSSIGWMHVVPNSRLYIIPYPADQPNRWSRKLYIMPGKVLRESIITFSAFFGLIGFVILFLHRREVAQDRRESRRNRFNFDTM